jgi:hypothetical protein
MLIIIGIIFKRVFFFGYHAIIISEIMMRVNRKKKKYFM